MPVFRDYTADVGQSGIPSGPRATAAAFGGQSAAAMQDLGQTGMQVARMLHEDQRRKSLLRARRDAALLREEAAAHLDELRQTGEPVGEQFSEYMESRTSDFIDAQETQEASMYAQQQSAALRHQLNSAARAVDADLLGEEARRSVQEVQQANGHWLQDHPEFIDEIVAEQTEFVNDMDIPEDLRKTLKSEMDRAAGRAAAQGYINLDPELAVEVLDSGRLDAYLFPEDAEAMRGRAETQIRALEQEERARRQEFEREKAIERQALYTDLIVRLHSSDPEDRATTADIAALAGQRFADGEPKITGAQADTAFRLRSAMAEGGAARTDPAVALDVISRLDTITEEELTEHFANRRISQSDFERWRKVAREGDTPLRSVRSEYMKRLDSFAAPQSLPGLLPRVSGAYARMEGRMLAHAMEREEEYREQGKNPLEYYSSGEFQSDAQTIASNMGVQGASAHANARLQELSEGREPVEGMAIGEAMELPNGDVLLYIGGDPYDYRNSWVTAEALTDE